MKLKDRIWFRTIVVLGIIIGIGAFIMLALLGMIAYKAWIM